METVVKFLKFSLVGFSGMILDFLVTFLLKEKAKIHRYVANSAGFTLAVTSNYLFNRIWTFMSDNPNIISEYSYFVAFAIVGLAINNFFLYVFEQWIGIRQVLNGMFNLDLGQQFGFYLAKMGAILITVIWNFFANYLITFNV